LVARAVELRPRVVGHAAVDRDPADAAALLRRADAVERDACTADERAAGLEYEARARPVLVHHLGERRDELANCRWMLIVVVPHGEAAADIDYLRLPAVLVAHVLAELDDPLDGKKALVRPRELRPDVHVDADHLEAAALDDVRGGVERQPELRAGVRGLDRLVR